MFETENDRKAFLEKYHISDESFRNSLLSWDELSRIASDFDSKKDGHECTVEAIAKEIKQCQHVHSFGYRVKETEHLIEKIIRKNPKCLEKGDMISVSNYEKHITDLMGLRILLLFKADWKEVHSYIVDRYGKLFNEEPFVYVRKGDDTSIYKGLIKIIEDPRKSYRSAHYVIRTESGACVEIQVRTLFEEAWSEVDHKIRYPYHQDNQMMNYYLNILNRLAGISDEMGSFICSYLKKFEDSERVGIATDNEVYSYILEQIQLCPDEQLKKNIIEKIESAENFRELKATDEFLSKILREL